MSFTVENMEYYLLVLIRVSSFVMTAPFLGYNAIPYRMKAAVSIMLSVIVIQMVPAVAVSYTGVFGFSALVLKEAAAGAILGFMCMICFYIVHFSGQLIDMEMGLSMATMFDPTSNIQVSISGNMYNYFVMLLLLVTNTHYYIIRAITDSFRYFNVGESVFRTEQLKNIMVEFIANYFVLAVRIVLPVFCCMLLINVVLGVLSKAAPQMNMFVVGIQIKVLVGIILLIVLIQTMPIISDLIFSEVKDVITQVIGAFKP